MRFVHNGGEKPPAAQRKRPEHAGGDIMTFLRTIQYDKPLSAKIRLRDGPADRVRGKPPRQRE